MRILHLPGQCRLKRSGVLAGQPVQVIDTGFAIHLQSEGVSKGTALVALARDMDLSPRDFFAIGDGENDVTDARIGRPWRDHRKCPPGNKSSGIRRDGGKGTEKALYRP